MSEKSQNRLSGSQMARWGMVAAAHPLAAFHGLEALKSGGNALDACLVMAGVTSVVLPHACGLGGDAFFIYYDASSGKITALNGSGAPGDGSTPEFFKGSGPILPQDGIHSVAVPGAPLVYELAAKRFGTFPLSKCFEPGVKVARDGFAVTPSFSKAIQAEREKIGKHPDTAKIFLPGGAAPRPGSTMKRPDMAESLRAFGEGGTQWFYKGDFAQAFYRMSAAEGGTF